MKNIELRCVLCIVALLLSPLALGAESVFGIPIGEPLAIRECSRTDTGNYEFFPEGLCYKRRFAELRGPVTNEAVTVGFAFEEWPKILSGKRPEALIIDGRVESISFATGGISDQSQVLSMLKSKYGEPDVFKPAAVQNRMGATFDVFTAVWVTESLTVAYSSTSGTTESGLVTIFTAKAAQHNKTEMAQQDKRRLGL